MYIFNVNDFKWTLVIHKNINRVHKVLPKTEETNRQIPKKEWSHLPFISCKVAFSPYTFISLPTNKYSFDNWILSVCDMDTLRSTYRKRKVSIC